MSSRLVTFVARPLQDWLDALDACVRGPRPAGIVGGVMSLVLTWWIYAPLHELAHAWGCVLTGGTVTRLEIGEIYGAALLAKIFPYVTVGSEYAGRLSGFDTRGSDVTYLATCALPFVMTVLVGVPLLHAVPRARGWRRGVMLGAALPIAYAPFVSLPGDYYEMGSILVSRIVAARIPGFPLDRWRSDDLVKLVGSLAVDGRPADVAGVVASLLLGAILAWATYWAGVLVSRALTRSETSPPSRGEG